MYPLIEKGVIFVENNVIFDEFIINNFIHIINEIKYDINNKINEIKYKKFENIKNIEEIEEIEELEEIEEHYDLYT